MEQILIQIPEGHVIDTEKSNLTKGRIVFKKKGATPWRNNKNALLSGYYVTTEANIESVEGLFNVSNVWNVFATKKQAQSMLAMARLSQIIKNDERFGGPITDEEWNTAKVDKYCIVRESNDICKHVSLYTYCFIAFHTGEQRDLFLKENEDLIRQYYMLD